VLHENNAHKIRRSQLFSQNCYHIHMYVQFIIDFEIQYMSLFTYIKLPIHGKYTENTHELRGQG